jgi:uncharacterized protein
MKPNLVARLLIALVQGYRLFFSAWLGAGCRYEPTCSSYALGALRQHGAAAGTLMAAGRLLRCHPGCAGGLDPVPEHPPAWLGRSASFLRRCACHRSTDPKTGRAPG